MTLKLFLSLLGLAWRFAVTVLRVKEEEQRAQAIRELATAFDFKDETGDTSLLERTIHDHFHSPIGNNKEGA